MAHDTAVVLPYLVGADGSLHSQTKDRLDAGIDMYREGLAEAITLTGGLCCRNGIYTNAEAMKIYTISHGINSKDIFLENRGLDTIAQAIFAKKHIVKPKHWKNLIVVSSDYHMPRVKEVFRTFYESSFDIEFEGVESGLAQDPQTRESENRSMEFLTREFRDINPEDDERMVKRLFEIDKRYNQNPPSTFH